MSFERRPADTWQRDIPGARWFKADLHVHTIDDHPGGRAGLPAGLSGDPADPDVISRYATLFLKCAIANGVQIIGLTPHSPRAGSTPETSAVWRIVEEWNHGTDDDGIPYREKIYAVFPGFEPNVNDGASGVHLLFLFDPEIGRDRYLSLYDAVMDGRTPWEYSALRPTPRGAHDVFETLDRSQRDIFGAGSPVIEIDCPGSDPAAPPHERWPAQFFAQNELQRLSIEASAVEDILARLVPSETRDIEERDQELEELDKQLHDMTKRLTNLDDNLAEAKKRFAFADASTDSERM